MSKQKRIVINNLERAVSSDHMRLQAFAAAEIAKVAGSPLASGPIYSKPTSKNLLTNSLVLDGLLVRPDPSLYVTVDAGTFVTWDPTIGDADDDGLILVDTTGITDSSLAFVANTSGVTRVDVFEVSYSVATVENSSRDIYDPSADEFYPTVVPKVTRPVAVFRVRNGAPGLTDDPDWLPLAVAFVKPTDSNYSTCDFFDVRPLMAEREPSMPRGTGGTRMLELAFKSSSGRITGYARGYFEGFAALSVGAAEDLRRTTPVSDGADFGSTGVAGGAVAYVDWTADNLANGIGTPADGTLVIAVALFPGLSSVSLPRWRRYAETGSPRLPTGPRGIITIQPKTVALDTYAATGCLLPAHMLMLNTTGRGLICGFGWYSTSDAGLYQVVGGAGWIGVPPVAAMQAPATAVDTSGAPTGHVSWASFPSGWTSALPPFIREQRVDVSITVATGGGATDSWDYWSLYGLDGANGYAPLVTNQSVYLPAAASGRVFTMSGTVINSGVSMLLRATHDVARSGTGGPSATAGDHTAKLKAIRYW